MFKNWPLYNFLSLIMNKEMIKNVIDNVIDLKKTHPIYFLNILKFFFFILMLYITKIIKKKYMVIWNKKLKLLRNLLKFFVNNFTANH